MAESITASSAPVAEIRETTGPAGRVWQFITSSEALADHAWLQRDRLLQLSDGAQSVEIIWSSPEGERTVLTHSPQLPHPGRHLATGAV